MSNRKIIGIVFICFSVFFILSAIQSSVYHANRCRAMKDAFIANPPYNIKDIIQTEANIDQLCKNYSNTLRIFLNFGALALGVYFVKEDKKIEA